MRPAAPARSCRGRARRRAGTSGGPAAAAATTCAWCGIRSRPGGPRQRRTARAASMHDGAPPAAVSKERSSGPSSSQPASRRVWGRGGGGSEKSGARNGLASCREMTDCGTTRTSATAGAIAVSAGAISSGADSMLRSRSISRLSDRAASETGKSSASSASSPALPTAVAARMAAMPSRRLSCSARWPALPGAVRARARSSRSSKATAWNFVRTAGVTRPRRAAASTSRAVGRVRKRRRHDRGHVPACAGRYGERPFGAGLLEPKTPPMECRARRPRQHAAQSHRRGEERPGQRACRFKRRADLRISEDRRSRSRQASHADPEPPAVGRRPRHWEKVVVGRPIRFSDASMIITRAGVHNSPPLLIRTALPACAEAYA